MTLENKFEGMSMDEPIKIEIEGEELELDVRVEDIVPMMSMGGQGGQDISEEDVEKLTDTFEKILYRTYLPYYDDVREKEPESLNESRQQENEEAKKFINGLLVRKLPVLINKLVSSLGWNDGVDMSDKDFPAPEA
jgi:ABC-type transporter MlaC component